MAMADNTEDNDPFEEDIVFDQAGLLGGRMPRSRQQATVGFLPTFMLFIRTVILCVAFLAMGLCTSVSGGPLIKLEITSGTEHSLAFHMYTARSAGMLVGGFIGALLFEVYNRQFLMFISLVWTAVSVTVLPFTVPVSLWWTFCSSASLGIGLGFFFTGGNVLCLDLWGRQGGASLQSLHFSFALGAFIAPLVIHPFFVGPFPAETLNGSLAAGDLSPTVVPMIDQNHIMNERALQEYSKDYGYEDYLEDFAGDAETSRVRRGVLANNNSSLDNDATSYDTTVSSILVNTLKTKELLNTSVPSKEANLSSSTTKGEATKLQEKMGTEKAMNPPVTTVHPRKLKPSKTLGTIIEEPNADWKSLRRVSKHKPALKKTETENRHETSTASPVKTSPTSVSTEIGDDETTTPASVQTDTPSTKSLEVIDNTPSPLVPLNPTKPVNITPVSFPSNVSTQIDSNLSNLTTEGDNPGMLKTVSNTSGSENTTIQSDTKVPNNGITTTIATISPVMTTMAIVTNAPPVTTTPASITDNTITASEANRNASTTRTSVTPSTVEPVSGLTSKEVTVPLFSSTSAKEDKQTTVTPFVVGEVGHLETENPSHNKETGNPPSSDSSYKTGGESEASGMEYKNETERGGVPMHTDSEHEMGAEGGSHGNDSQKRTGGQMPTDTELQEPQQISDKESSIPEVSQSHSSPEESGGQPGNESNVESGEESEEKIPISQGKDLSTSLPAFSDYSASEPEVEPLVEKGGETDAKSGTTASPLPAGENSSGSHNTLSPPKPGTSSDESEENHQFLDDVAHRFKNYGVTKIHLAYISIGIFVILNSFVSVVVLCHNPREPRSKQDDGTLDEVHKGRMILFVVMFSMFMFMGEALQGAVHHLLTSTTTGTGLDVIEESGIDGQLLFWGLVCIIRFLCIFISGCLRLKPGKLLCSSALFTVIGTVFLAVGSFDKDDFLWAGIIVVALGLAPILPTSLLWMAQHMRVTHRMCALMIILASAGNSLTHSLLTHVLGSSHLYAYILVTVSFISMLFLLISMCAIYTAQQSKTLGVPVGYQLANQHEEEDVLEMTPADSAVFNRNHHLVRENGESGQSLLLE